MARRPRREKREREGIVVATRGGLDPFDEQQQQRLAADAERERRRLARQADLRRRRLELARKHEREGASGPQRAREARRAGFVPGGSAYKKPRGPTGLAAKVIGDLMEAGMGTPRGVAVSGKALALDTRDFYLRDFYLRDFPRSIRDLREKERRLGRPLTLGEIYGSGARTALGAYPRTRNLGPPRR